MKTQVLFCSLLLAAASFLAAAPVGTVFTYQGRLSDGAHPAAGLYDLQFLVHDAEVGGTQVGSTLVTNGVPVTNGLFTVRLDFGGIFDGSQRWLVVGVRTNGSGSGFTILSPRQPLTPAPYALYAPTAGAAATAVTATTAASADSVSAANLTSGTVPDTRLAANVARTHQVWLLGGNSGTAAGTQFLGTTDNQPLELKVNGQRAMRLEYANNGSGGIRPNVIGGASENAVGSYGSVIGGGWGHRVETGAHYAVIAGGSTNVIQTNAAFAGIAGGANNVIGADAQRSSIGGGNFNVISNLATDATIPGGYHNTVGQRYSLAAGQRAKANHQGSFVWSDSQGADFASTAQNQFLVRAGGGVGIGTNNPQSALHVAGTVRADAFVSGTSAPASFGSVGIGTAAPQDALLDLEGDMHLNDHDLFLRGGTDRNHGLGWYGLGKLFGGLNVDGPVLYGWSGGGLGTLGGGATNLALGWNTIGNAIIDPQGRNTGELEPGLVFGPSSGEGIASQRIAGPGAFGLDFYTYFQKRLTITQNGDVGIGTAIPSAKLDVAGLIKASSFGGSGLGLTNVGTLDVTPFEARVDNMKALRLEPGNPLYHGPHQNVNVILGCPSNAISSQATASAIGGGGGSGGSGADANAVLGLAEGAVIGGGMGNRIFGPDVAGPEAYGSEPTIGGGGRNEISANAGTIGGGYRNRVQLRAHYATVGGGSDNVIQTNAAYSSIGGGSGNVIETCESGGGTFPRGRNTVGGGENNRIQTNAYGCAIVGGLNNTIQTNASHATIGGGFGNTVRRNANGATIPGGVANAAAGNYSFAAGYSAIAQQPGSFVWADSKAWAFDPFAQSGPQGVADSFNVRATGGIYLVTTLNGTGGITGGTYINASSGGWQTLSDRSTKTNLAPVDAKQVLERLAAIPITEWSYSADADARRHVGPMAQDFNEAFGLGDNEGMGEKKYLSSTDVDGVALAAIQGLNQKVVEENRALRSALDAREAELQSFRLRLEALEQKLGSGGAR